MFLRHSQTPSFPECIKLNHLSLLSVLNNFTQKSRTFFLHGCSVLVLITQRSPLLHSDADEYKSHRQHVITSRQQCHLLHHLIEFRLIFYVVTSLKVGR